MPFRLLGNLMMCWNLNEKRNIAYIMAYMPYIMTCHIHSSIKYIVFRSIKYILFSSKLYIEKCGKVKTMYILYKGYIENMSERRVSMI